MEERGKKPARPAGFPAASPETFGSDYLHLVESGADPAAIAQWCFANAGAMNEAMFLDPSLDWARFDPHHLLALRACAPAGVFTSTAKGGFLSKVGGNPELVELAEVLFRPDYEFAARLPDEVRPELVQLMQLAFRRGIRPADPRVKSM